METAWLLGNVLKGLEYRFTGTARQDERDGNLLKI